MKNIAQVPSKTLHGLGMSWEDGYGYQQAVKVGDTIYVSGQLGHDDQGQLVAPVEDERLREHAHMEAQMRQTYVNAKKILSKFGATLENVVEEVLYVTDMAAGFAVAGPVRKDAYGTPKPAVASTIVGTPALVVANQLVEIKFVARLT